MPIVRRRSVFGGPRGEASFSLLLLAVGVGSIAFGIMDDAAAQVSSGAVINYTDDRVVNNVEVVMTYMEGSFGALLMVVAGIATIVTTALAKYKSSKKLLVLALVFFAIAAGLFFGRAVTGTFFNDDQVIT